MLDNLPKSLMGRLGFGTLLFALLLAPTMGGFPGGPTYGADVSLGAMRCFVLIAAMLLFLSERVPMPAAPKGNNGLILRNRMESILWLAVALTGISLLAQSRFLTSPVLLFASLPGAIDWVCFGLLFSMAVRFAQGKALFWILGALLAGAGLSAIISVQEYGQFVQMGEAQRRAQGLFFSPNFSGGLMALLLPAVIAACIAARQRLLALGLGALAAMMAGALFASGSRASIALTAVGLVVALVFSVTKLAKLPGAVGRIVVLIVVLLGLGFAFRGPLVQRVAAAGQEQSGQFRTWTAKGTLVMAKAHPILGSGPGTFPYLYPKYALVGRTDLAHSSYLQMAAEEGFPALILVVVCLGAIVVVAGVELTQSMRSTDTDAVLHVFRAGLLGGLLAGIARSAFDSEWSIAGNAYAFWTVAGLVLMSLLPSIPLTVAGLGKAKTFDTRMVVVPGLVVALVFSLLCLRTAQTRTAVQAQMQGGENAISDGAGWPPDPQLYYFAKKLEEAALIEPTGKRYYQLGRFLIEQNNLAGGIAALKNSVAVEPVSMQSWRRLAEMQERAGDTTGALESWRKLIEQQEGPVGQIRAIPEATETYAAFAYTALARDAAKRSDVTEVARLYEKAAGIVENYAKTPPLYQQMELETARVAGVNIESRREELRNLYKQVMQEWASLQPERSAELAAQRDDILDKLSKMTAPANTPAS